MQHIITIEELRTRSLWDLRKLREALRRYLAELRPGTAEHAVILQTLQNVEAVLFERKRACRP
jgi:hypothetical protein